MFRMVPPPLSKAQEPLPPPRKKTPPKQIEKKSLEPVPEPPSNAAITDSVIKVEAPEPSASDTSGPVDTSYAGPPAPAVDTNQVYSSKEIIGGIVAIYKLEVPYPPLAREMGIEGHVRALALVNREGMVTSVKIEKSDHPAFNKPVQRTLLTWKYQPARIKGIAVRVAVKVELDFVLK
jgi:TonB family protein